MASSSWTWRRANPIYLELLPDAVQKAVGRVHREGEAARAMLAREGFRPQNLVDIFDAGPTFASRRDEIVTVRESRVRRTRIVEAVEGPARLVSREGLTGFRAARAAVHLTSEEAEVGRDLAEALGLAEGDPVRVAS